jgi:cathepsin F
LIAFATCHFEKKEAFTEFQEFIKKYHKKYNTLQEYMARFRVFKKNYLMLKKFNGNTSGITKFMDLTRDEFRRKYLNLNISVLNTIRTERIQIKTNDAPETFDWRNEGAVNAVKDQAQCGSCWAFATAANLEGLYYLKNKQSMTFSEQQLVDCDTIDNGCNGGLMENTFTWLKTHGIMSDLDYPYEGYEGNCREDPSKYKMKISGFTLLDSRDEKQIKEFLYKTGPLAIALNANYLQFYYGGILDVPDVMCDPDQINHAVTLVGYGSENGQDYWIVKNSWGQDFGEEGYFRIARGKGTCGINTYISTADL